MKTKQFANVLIKLLGIHFCLEDIASFISEVLIALHRLLAPAWNQHLDYEWAYVVSGIIRLLVGVFFILKSQKIADYLFKDEHE